MLTAGLATRLQPLSSVRAKAALPVAGTPLVVRILHWLRDAGVRRTVLNLHHRADTITRIVGDGSQLGIDVRYSWETDILGSAGGPARAIPLLASDRFLIVNGDTLADVDLRAMAAQHIDTNALVTMAVVDGRPEYNGVIADASGIVSGFGREPGAFHFIGIQMVNASVFAGVDPDAEVRDRPWHLPAGDREPAGRGPYFSHARRILRHRIAPRLPRHGDHDRQARAARRSIAAAIARSPPMRG